MGALVGSAELDIDARSAAAAVRLLGLDSDVQLVALKRGARFGRRAGGRIRRSLTPVQFVRIRRGRLARDLRPAFERAIVEIDDRFPESVRPRLRDATFRLMQFDGPGVVEQYLQLVERVAAAIGRSAEDRDAGPILAHVAEHLARMFEYGDVPSVAAARTRPDRLAKLRRRHGISRQDRWDVDDVLMIARAEIEALKAKPNASTAVTAGREDDAAYLLGGTENLVIRSTTIRGVLRLRRLARLGRRRSATARCQLEWDAARLYVDTVLDAVTVSEELAEIVAASGALVQGTGVTRVATRRGAVAWWGRVVRPLIALDRAGIGGRGPCSTMFIPWAWSLLRANGELVLWEFAAQVTGISLEHARTRSADRAWDQLAAVRASLGGPPATNPEPALQSESTARSVVAPREGSVNDVDRGAQRLQADV